MYMDIRYAYHPILVSVSCLFASFLCCIFKFLFQLKDGCVRVLRKKLTKEGRNSVHTSESRDNTIFPFGDFSLYRKENAADSFILLFTLRLSVCDRYIHFVYYVKTNKESHKLYFSSLSLFCCSCFALKRRYLKISCNCALAPCSQQLLYELFCVSSVMSRVNLQQLRGHSETAVA